MFNILIYFYFYLFIFFLTCIKLDAIATRLTLPKIIENATCHRINVTMRQAQANILWNIQNFRIKFHAWKVEQKRSTKQKINYSGNEGSKMFVCRKNEITKDAEGDKWCWLKNKNKKKKISVLHLIAVLRENFFKGNFVI